MRKSTFHNIHLYSNKNLVTEFMIVKVSQNLNSMQKISAQRNHEHSSYVFSNIQMSTKHSKTN